MLSFAQIDLLYLGYIFAFAGAGIACFSSLSRVSRISDPDTRRGLLALLALSGLWASMHVGYLIVQSSTLQYGFYVAGLVFGIATVGPWLYFCSAYTGRRLHHLRPIRYLAVGVFVAIILVKLTNPVHGLYFTTESVTEPFAHMAVQHHTIHWIVMGLSYALATVGYFMLLERFLYAGYDTRPLIGLVGLTALPLGLAVGSHFTSIVIDIGYESLGVAVFAVGVLFLYFERFQAVQLAGDVDDPVVLLDEQGRIRECNTAAIDLFPELETSIGDSLEAVVSGLASSMESEDEVLSLDRDGKTRYYLATTTPFTAGNTQIGQLLTIVDVTRSERYRQELERETERLDQFSSVVAHDLRNPLSVAQGYLEAEREVSDSENLDNISNALSRMETLISDLLALARDGRDVDDPESVSLAAVVEESRRTVDDVDVVFVGDSAVRIRADPDRLRQLLENLFRNAIEHGGRDVTIRVGLLEDDTGFFVEDDGVGLPAETRNELFEPGVTSSEDGTGFGLAIVAEIANAHGWTVSATDAASGGARFELREVERATPVTN